MGGAKNCPETPRQRMIGMMYLVLTAMLALNVSADIINGFTKLRHSMESSIESTATRTEDVIQIFQEAYNKDEAGRVKYGEWWAIAQAIGTASDEFYNYIEQFKLDIASQVDGKEYTTMPDKLKNGSDTNRPHAYALVEKVEGGKTRAEILEEKMDAYREYMTSADSDCVRKKLQDAKFKHDLEAKFALFSALFNTDDVTDEEGNTLGWAQSTFHEMPAAAVIALLTKYQNDICVAENDLINFLYNAAGSSNFVVNSITAVVLPQNGEYVMQGGRYRAKIVSGAVDTLNLPQVFINGQEIEGGIYDVAATQVGPHKYNGYILMPGDTTRYSFEGQYTVGAPSAAIANIELNMMYSGYANKFRISVPGFADDKISVECAGASISRDGKDWIINPKGGKEATIQVYAQSDGHKVLMGSEVFRVRPLPSPDAYISFGGQESSAEKQKKSIMTSGQISIVASYGPDSPLKAKFTVENFSVKFPNGQEAKCSGGKLSADALSLMKQVRPGSAVWIRHVMAKGPDGKVRELRSLSIELQ